jgi:hypothetical protein
MTGQHDGTDPQAPTDTPATPPLPYADDERFSAWLDGELTGAAAVAFEAEMADNPEMQHLLDDLRALRATMRRLSEEEAPRGLWHRLAVMVRGDTGTGRAPSFEGPVLLLLAVVAVLYFVAGLSGPTPGVEATVQTFNDRPRAHAVGDAMREGASPEEAKKAAEALPLRPLPPPGKGFSGRREVATQGADLLPYDMAPASYRLWGEDAVEVLRQVAASVGGRLVTFEGAPTEVVNGFDEVWVELPAHQIGPLRRGLDERLRVETIGMPSVISGTHRQRFLIPDE